MPEANFKDFDALCKLLPENITLPAYDTSVTEHCQNFTSGTATAEFCNLDLCSPIKVPNLHQGCEKLVQSCFGSKRLPVPYTRGYSRLRTPKGYWALSVNESTPSIGDLEPVCNGVAVENGTILDNPNNKFNVPDPRQWLKDMEKLIKSRDPPQ